MMTSTAARAMLMGLALLLGLGPLAHAEPLKIRIAWTTVPGQLTPILFKRKDLAPHLGTSYVVEHSHFAGSGPMVTALATGDVDIAPLSPAAFGAALQNAQVHDLRIITDDYQDGVPGYYSGEFLVRADSAIHRIEDLKDKALAVNAIGGGSDSALRAMLRLHHLDARRDYTVVEASFGNMPAMLADGKVDLISEVLPFSLALRRDGHVRTLFRMRDVFGTTQSLFNVARADFLNKNRAALADFFEDYVRALRWLLDPDNRDAAVRMVADFNKRPAEVFQPYLFTQEDNYRDRNARPNLVALQENMRQQRQLGFIDINIDVTKYADLGFLETAVNRLR